jgi:quercetin dioxygenase-like cupin family protein
MTDTVKFNFNDPEGGLERELAPGMITRLFWGKQAMMSLITAAPSTAGQMHWHDEEQWAVCLEGSGVLIVGGVEHDIGPGDVLMIPGGTPHNFIAGPGGARVLDVFAPPRQGYTSAGKGFAAKG